MSLGAALIIMSLVLRENVRPLVAAMTQVFASPSRYPLNNAADIISLLSMIGGAAAIFLVPVLALMLVSTIVAAFAQGVPQISVSRIAPKFSKISPAAGLKRLLSKRGLIEFLKERLQAGAGQHRRLPGAARGLRGSGSDDLHRSLEGGRDRDWT